MRQDHTVHLGRPDRKILVDKNILSLLLQPRDDSSADSVKELHADFIVGNRVTELRYEPFDVIHRVKVERYD